MKLKINFIGYKISILLLIICIKTHGQPINVIIKHGNVWVIDTSGAEKQITTSGMDTIPCLSNDKRYIAFVRKTKMLKSSYRGFDSSQIWLIDLDSITINRVVQAKPDSGATLSLLKGGFDALQFSPDSKCLYYLSNAWTVSMAVHRLDLTTKQDRFITDGNSLFVIYDGVYEGDLVVEKHTATSPYVDNWLLTPDGTQIQELGLDKKLLKIKQ